MSDDSIIIVGDIQRRIYTLHRIQVIESKLEILRSQSVTSSDSTLRSQIATIKNGKGHIQIMNSVGILENLKKVKLV